jgi:hypothetical protein
MLLERHKKKTTASAASLPPILITITVLPALSDQASYLVSSQAGTPALDMPSKHTLIDLKIPGLRDILVKEYCAWQQLQVDDTT